MCLPPQPKPKPGNILHNASPAPLRTAGAAGSRALTLPRRGGGEVRRGAGKAKPEQPWASASGNEWQRRGGGRRLPRTCARRAAGKGDATRGSGVRGVRRLSLLSGWLSCESKSAPKVAVHGQQQSATGRACACPPRPRHAGVSHTSPCTPGAPGVAPGQGTRPFVHGGLPVDPRGEWLPRGTRRLMAEWGAPRRPFVPGPATFGN